MRMVGILMGWSDIRVRRPSGVTARMSIRSATSCGFKPLYTAKDEGRRTRLAANSHSETRRRLAGAIRHRLAHYEVVVFDQGLDGLARQHALSSTPSFRFAAVALRFRVICNSSGYEAASRC